MLLLQTKRVYEPVEVTDGKRILVDRLWPRGVAKETACIDEWLKDLAPSTELRKWFAHEPTRFEEFRSSYLDELRNNSAAQVQALQIIQWAEEEQVTILFAAKDSQHNNAVVLKGFLLGMWKKK
ncbi:DUF488 domain-containing protein [Fodinisporobacter ferrooxydans]|uniref:DUF488 domain-containing protein n=1 Tax=Fodinisporobacter ferrooxydans TaxID=2901836 RepID=A0ABY4CMC7_9BACL|nr:DUF488 domain-containing protein [Alicyclobacillaceae bacterium MYW30-H2]